MQPMKASVYSTVLLNLVLTGCTGEPSSPLSELAGLQGQYCFERHVIDNTGSGADGVHLGDINNDGYLDVVSGWEESAELKLYLHPGAAISTRPANWQSIDVGTGSNVSAIEDAAFIDMDGDGKVDSILSATEGEGADSNRRVRLHRASGENLDQIISNAWQASVIHIDQPTARFMKVRGAQLDNQYGADIVALSRDLFENPQDPDEITTRGGVFLYTSPPPEKIDKPDAWKRQRLADVHKGKSIALVDMDADKDLDILYSGARNIVWLENPLIEGAGNDWTSHWIGTASDLALCDINADGIQDIVATTSRKEYPVVARWFEGSGGRTIRKRAWPSHDIELAENLPSKFYQPDNFAVKSIACAQFSTGVDAGSVADTPASIVITTSGSGFGIFLAVAPKNFSSDYTQPWHALPLTSYRWIMKYDNIIATDLDADGDTDLLTSEENEGIFLQGAGVLWYENRPCD
ncbi:MAG: hypothetical protein ACI9NT_000459 [Bacteroidia bacterium]